MGLEKKVEGGKVMFKPVYQTRFGVPKGNCFMSCVASILGVSLDDLPDLYKECDNNGKNWVAVTEEGIKRFGYRMFIIANDLADVENFYPQGYAIAGGGSPRGIPEGHAVVYKDGRMIHDPHPDGAGVTSIEEWYLFFREFNHKDKP